MQPFPPNHRPGLRWCEQTEEKILRFGFPPMSQGSLIAIINAIECQFEEEADPESIRLLIGGLLRFAQARGASPQDLGVLPTAEAITDSLRSRTQGKTR